MKIEEKQSFAPTCVLSCDDFWIDCSLQGSRCIYGCNQLSSSDFLCCLCSRVSPLMLLMGHSSLHKAFASVSQRKPLLAELPKVCWAGSCSWHYLHSANWNSTPVMGDETLYRVCSQPGQPGLSNTTPFFHCACTGWFLPCLLEFDVLP